MILNYRKVHYAKQGDIILNETYETLGSHYMMAIMPTGDRKPKQEASVEDTVGKVATAIIESLWMFNRTRF